MAWNDRLRETINLKSPQGNIFVPLWQGSTRVKEKKLGTFTYPLKLGSFVQDLDVNASKYPMTVFFEGPDNDLESQRFWSACDENGKWEVIHPVHGKLTLQLSSITENNQPITSGNVTAFDLDWIESIAIDEILSSQELASLVDAQQAQSNLTSADQLNDSADLTKVSAVQAIKNTAASISTISNNILSPLFEQVAELNSLFNAIQRGIQDTLDAVILKPLTLAGQIQQLIQTPALATNDIESRLSTYESLAAGFSELSPEGITQEDKNQVLTQELGLSAVLVAVANVVITGPLATRAQAIESTQRLITLFDSITETLDDTQELFQNNDIEFQYFSQTQAYSDLTILIGQALKYLLLALFDLKIEKRFTIERDRAPIEITITEYGDLGENDINFDLFISSNELKGNDILLLKAGTEVVVYV